MNNIQEAQFLRENRSALVAQLNDLGVIKVNDNTPLSELADYMRWAGGLRDLRLAVINRSTGAYSDYSEDEWNGLSAFAKASCVKLGIRIRAERLDFIISKDYVTRSNGSSIIPWLPNASLDVKGLTNYGDGSTGYLKDIDGEANTNLILSHKETSNLRFEAAEQARAYKASTVADGGFDDPTVWSLPAIGQLWLLYKYYTQINTAITAFFGSAYIINTNWHWSSTECDSTNAWVVDMNIGMATRGSKANSYSVRAVAPVPSSVI